MYNSLQFQGKFLGHDIITAITIIWWGLWSIYCLLRLTEICPIQWGFSIQVTWSVLTNQRPEITMITHSIMMTMMMMIIMIIFRLLTLVYCPHPHSGDSTQLLGWGLGNLATCQGHCRQCLESDIASDSGNAVFRVWVWILLRSVVTRQSQKVFLSAKMQLYKSLCLAQ